MLVLGLPLVMICGLLLALLLLPDLSFWEAALLAALLAPTDAALGQAVVSAREVPARIRQAINVESGLNDGIALPAVLLFAALASAAAAVDSGDWLRFAALQIVLAPVVGGILGYLGARGIDAAAQKGWAGDSFLGIGILSLAFLAFVLSELIGGNGFIAVFVAGMIFGHSLQHPCTFLFEFMETEGQLLRLLTFLIFGAALLPEALAHVEAATFGYAIASLTVVRILPMGCSLLGSGLAWPSVLFLGWFGPRGLASILFVLLILESSDVSNKEQIFAVTMVTVALSAVLHGISAAPFARVYARRAAGMGDCEENRPVMEMPLRDQVTAKQEMQERS